MPELIEKKCQNCNKLISVRMADHKRGWGKFCSKACKAKRQERINGQHAAFLHGRGVSNLHPERLKYYTVNGELRMNDNGKEYYWDDSDLLHEEWKELHSDDHPFSPDALGQWND